MTASIEGHAIHGAVRAFADGDAAVLLDDRGGGTAPGDLVRPGHVIPLRTRTDCPDTPGGRALALTAAAGFPAAVMCGAVSLRDPRSDADADNLADLAERDGLPVVTARDLLLPGANR